MFIESLLLHKGAPGKKWHFTYWKQRKPDP